MTASYLSSCRLSHDKESTLLFVVIAAARPIARPHQKPRGWSEIWPYGRDIEQALREHCAALHGFAIRN